MQELAKATENHSAVSEEGMMNLQEPSGDDLKKMEIVGAILKLLSDMQSRAQELLFEKCGDLSWLGFYNQHFIETFIKKMNVDIE